MYELKNVPIFQAIYGPGMISLGGIQAVECMLSGVELNGKRVLDIGSGIGGMVHWIARNHKAEAIGIDIHPWMADYAQAQTPSQMLGSCSFLTYDGTHTGLEANSVDVVLSKGVLTNIENKAPLLSEIARICKTGSEIVFIDWLAPESTGGTNETLPLGDRSRKETRKSYTDLFEASGLGAPTFSDVTDEYLEYVKNLGIMLRSAEHSRNFKEVISDELRADLIRANDHLENEIREGRQFSIRVSAGLKGENDG